MKKQVVLTDTDRAILESYKSVLDGLAEYLGGGYEMVLHSLEDFDQAAIKVINGHYTGRSEGAPITDLALEMLDKIETSDDKHGSLVYFNRNAKGVPIRSATIPIVGSGERVIGLLCMNFYMDMPFHVFLDSMANLHPGRNDTVEIYANDSDELILSVLKNAETQVKNDAAISASNKNKEIIALLCQKNIFNLKDAVVKVAAYLKISKNTVYMHLRNRGK